MSGFILVYYGLLGAGLLVGAARYRSLIKGGRYFVWLIAVVILTEALSYYLAKVYKSNLIISHFFCVIQVVLVLKGYQEEMEKHRSLNRILRITVLFAALINIALFADKLTTVYPTELKTACNLVMVGWCLLYFYELLQTPKEYGFNQYPFFWISTGLLLNILLTLFNFSSFNFLIEFGKSYTMIFQIIRIMANYILYGLLIVSFFVSQYSLNDK